MKFSASPLVLLAAAGLSTPLLAQDAPPKTDAEKSSYAIGADIARSLKQQGIEVDQTFLAAGFRDVTANGKLLMSTDDMAATLRTLKQTQMSKMQDVRKAAATTNQAEGDKFLADNKGKPGVTTLPDGLQYKVLTQGNGPTPKASDTVTVNYRGTFLNGTEFDSSYKRNEPATFEVGGVIKGWTEILQMMKVGSKYQVFIPGNLAYGERGMGQDIPPNTTLIFEVELLGIK